MQIAIPRRLAAGTILATLAAALIPTAASAAAPVPVDQAVLITEGVTSVVTTLDGDGEPIETVEYAPGEELPGWYDLSYAHGYLTRPGTHAVGEVDGGRWVGPWTGATRVEGGQGWCDRESREPYLLTGADRESLTASAVRWEVSGYSPDRRPILAPTGEALYVLGYEEVASCPLPAHMRVRLTGAAGQLTGDVPGVQTHVRTAPVEGHWASKEIHRAFTHDESTAGLRRGIAPGVTLAATVETVGAPYGSVVVRARLVDDESREVYLDARPNALTFEIPEIPAGRSATLEIEIGMPDAGAPDGDEGATPAPEPDEGNPPADPADEDDLTVARFDRPVALVDTGLPHSIVEVRGAAPDALDIAPYAGHVTDETRAAVRDQCTDPAVLDPARWDEEQCRALLAGSLRFYAKPILGNAAAWELALDAITAQRERNAALRVPLIPDEDGTWLLMADEDGLVAFAGEEVQITVEHRGGAGTDPDPHWRSATFEHTPSFAAASVEERLRGYAADTGMTLGDGSVIPQSPYAEHFDRYEVDPQSGARYGAINDRLWGLGPLLRVDASRIELPVEHVPGGLTPEPSPTVVPVPAGTSPEPAAVDDQPQELARTGIDVTTTVLWGAGVLLVGAAAILIAFRRQLDKGEPVTLDSIEEGAVQ